MYICVVYDDYIHPFPLASLPNRLRPIPKLGPIRSPNSTHTSSHLEALTSNFCVAHLFTLRMERCLKPAVVWLPGSKLWLRNSVLVEDRSETSFGMRVSGPAEIGKDMQFGGPGFDRQWTGFPLRETSAWFSPRTGPPDTLLLP
jgi:hypothetical protein